MIELFDRDVKDDGRLSSKGNQLKWYSGGRWYKTDYTGYEGFSEYVVSKLLELSSLNEEEFVAYRTEEIRYNGQRYTGCSSENFLRQDWQMITLERLFQQTHGKSLYKSVCLIEGVAERLRFLTGEIERITGLSEIGSYLAKLMTIDAVFLNEDRHMHNIALLLDPEGYYHPCPMFDHGAALLSDTSMDFPMKRDVYKLAEHASAKTISDSFDEQLDAGEELYGKNISFHFTYRQAEEIVEEDTVYTEEVHDRVLKLVAEGRRRYSYLFTP